MLQGIILSRGMALGELYVYTPYIPRIEPGPCSPEETVGQRDAYRKARDGAARELEVLIENLRTQKKGESDIFSAHLEIVNDEVISEEIEDAILCELSTAGEAVDRIYRNYSKAVSKAKDPLIQERARDMDDVRNRILRNLQGLPEQGLSCLTRPCIVATKEVLPSEIAQMDPALILGIITQEGSSTCHAAIMTRNMGIPAIFGIDGLMKQVTTGMQAILDGEEGLVLLEPDKVLRAEYQKREAAFRRQAQEAKEYREREAVTGDGRKIEICLNLGDEQVPPELGLCDGVGLLRSEFLFMNSDHLPTEEEQFQVYRSILEAAGGKPVTLRTLDIGGDKQLEYLPLPKEENPFLGVRALRLCFQRPEIMRTQLRAALRASIYGTLWLMFPMVGSLEDWQRARAFYETIRSELTDEGIPVSEQLRLGVMIEIPSAALLAGALAQEVDFASVGTNDLCQYLFAADRTNREVESYAQKYSPVLLGLLGQIAAEFEKAGKPLSICGELGGDTLATAALVGLGYRKLSMSPICIGGVKRVICQGSYESMRTLAGKILKQKTQDEAVMLLRNYEKGKN